MGKHLLGIRLYRESAWMHENYTGINYIDTAKESPPRVGGRLDR